MKVHRPLKAHYQSSAPARESVRGHDKQVRAHHALGELVQHLRIERLFLQQPRHGLAQADFRCIEMTFLRLAEPVVHLRARLVAALCGDVPLRSLLHALLERFLAQFREGLAALGQLDSGECA